MNNNGVSDLTQVSPDEADDAGFELRRNGSRPEATEASPAAPLPYPHGWFYLTDTRELKPAAVLRKRLMDEEVVVYRTRSGVVCAVRPYCPHLGAHLGVGGAVVNENLVCPFHRFAFATDGRCVDSPDGATIGGRLEHYEVRQHHGMVFVWRGDDGSPPAWELPEVADPDLMPSARATMDISTHPQEIAENAADFRHLPALHGINGLQAAPCDVNGPYFRVHTRSAGKVLSKLLPGAQSILLAGLGYSLIEFPLPQIGITARVWGLTTPIGPWQTRLHLAVSAEHRQRGSRIIDRLIAQIVLRGTIRVIRQDMPIWTNKSYNPHPRLAKGEQALSQFRRWTRQFYPAR